MATVFEVRDEVWEIVEPLLPAAPEQTTGRPRMPDRVAFNAIMFVLVTGIAWRFMPREPGCSGVTAWRRLKDRQAAGVWERAHAALLDQLNAAGAIDWSAASSTAATFALFKGALTGLSPVDRARTGLQAASSWSTRPASRWRSP